ncbi:MAG: hypothetical protein ACREOZ_03015 [Gloeomargaritales cyanobacterium]
MSGNGSNSGQKNIAAATEKKDASFLSTEHSARISPIDKLKEDAEERKAWLRSRFALLEQVGGKEVTSFQMIRETLAEVSQKLWCSAQSLGGNHPSDFLMLNPDKAKNQHQRRLMPYDGPTSKLYPRMRSKCDQQKI